MKLTDRTIAALPPPVRHQKLYSDGSLPSFGVRVSKGGAKTFVLTLGQDRHRVVIGHYPVVSLSQARTKAREILAKRQLGLDMPRSPKLGAIIEEFLAVRQDQLRATSYQKDMHRLKAFAALAGQRLGDIEPEVVQAILDRRAAPATRHECLVRFKLLIRFAIKRRYIKAWPLDSLEGRRKRVSRERVLSGSELRQVLHTARVWANGGHHYGTIVELLAYTGQRRGQIGSLRLSHIDFENDTITWPAELMKAGRKHMIPMGAHVHAILEGRRTKDLYFPNKYDEPFSFASAHDRAFRADCGFADWVLHDLRRTMATRWQEMGVELATTEKMLAHSAITGGLIGVYQRSSYLRQMREAVVQWENWLQALLSKQEEPDGRYVDTGADAGIHNRAA